MTKGKEITSWYYAKNRERLLEYQKKYNKENSEKIKIYSRNYGKGYFQNNENFLKQREANRKYREKNREKLREYHREYQRKKRALMKKSRATKEAHTPNTKKGSGDWHVSHTSMGMGDYYGTGVRQKIGRMRSDSMGMTAVTPKKLKTPPRSVA